MLVTVQLILDVCRLVKNSGRLFLKNTALILLVPMLVTMIFSWNASMSITMKVLLANMSQGMTRKRENPSVQ